MKMRMRKAFRYVWRGIKDVLWTVPVFLTVGIVATSILVLLAAGVDALPLTLGEILAILGIWLMIGVLLGQNKSSKGSQGGESARANRQIESNLYRV